jgi:hypothetical protein
VVADALSRKPGTVNTLTTSIHPRLQEEFAKLNMVLCGPVNSDTLEITPTLMEEIKKAQGPDKGIQEIKELMHQGKAKCFRVDDQGTLWFEKRICVPDQDNLRQQILREAHESAYSIHPGGTKMYQDLRETFWCPGMRRDIAYYVACCDVCNKVKAEH